MAEVGEFQRLPRAGALEEEGHVAEDVVPPVARLHQRLQLRGDKPGVDVAAEVDWLEWIDRDEIGPEPAFALEALLQGVQLLVRVEPDPNVAGDILRAIVRSRHVRAEGLL